MDVKISSAAAAYAARQAQPRAPAASPQESAPGGEFSNLVKTAVQDTTATVRGAEQASLAALAGKASVVDVVTAVSSAEVALQTVIAVRDRVVQAYQEILRMPI